MNDIVEVRDFFFDIELDGLIDNLITFQNHLSSKPEYTESDSLSYGFTYLPDEGFPHFIEAIVLKMKIQLKLQSGYSHVQVVNTFGIRKTNRLYPVEFTNELSKYSNEATIIQLGCNGLLNNDRIVYANSVLFLPFKHFIYSPSDEESEQNKTGFTFIFHKRA